MKNSLGLLLISFLLITPLHAKEIQRISLQEAIHIALDNSLELEMAKNEISRSESQYRRQKADFFPNLNASVSGNQTIGRQFDPAAFAFDDFTTRNLTANISSSVVLFNGFRNINELRSTRIGKESTEERYQRTRERIIFDTAARFLNLLLAKELFEINKENVEAGKRQLEQVEAQVEVGIRPVVDLYNQESIVANNELSLIQSENALKLSKLRLSSLLQLDPLGEYEFLMPDINEDKIVIRDYDLSQMIRVALDNRSDYKAGRLDVNQARYALQISQAGRIPEISLSGYLSSAYRNQQREPVPGNPAAQGDVMPFTDQFFDANINRAVSFNVRVPIFNRWQTRNQIQQRKIDYKNARLRLQDLEQELFLELQQAFNDYTGFVKELEATQKALFAAEKAFETEQERYNVGSATLIELTNANNEFVRASSNRVQALYQFVFQEKVLDYFLGRITENVDIAAFSE